MPTKISDLLIIGGGLHGCASALFAAHHGLRVTLLEKDSIGRHASGVNAGGVRRLGRALPEIALSCRAMQMWRQIETIVDDDCGFHSVPQIKVAENDDDLAFLTERVSQLAETGFSHEQMIDRQTLRAFLPNVSEHCVGGLHSDDGYAMPYQTTAAFARKARALGVSIHEAEKPHHIVCENTVWRVETNSGSYRAKSLLNCAGAWGGEIASQIGDHAPVEAIAPLMIVTQRMKPFCTAVVGTARRPLSFKQMANGTVVIGGGRLGHADLDTNRSDISFAELRHTARTASDIFPVMRKAVVQRTWSGIEGRTPDSLPIIGRSLRHENAFHAIGFSAHGFQLGPAIGALMADFIATGTRPPELAPFTLERFDAANIQPERK